MEHRNVTRGNLHCVANWNVASTAERDAIAVTESDIGKQCWVRGVGHFVLAVASPMAWEAASVVNPTVSAVLADSAAYGVWATAHATDTDVLNTLVYVTDVKATYFITAVTPAVISVLVGETPFPYVTYADAAAFAAATPTIDVQGKIALVADSDTFYYCKLYGAAPQWVSLATVSSVFGRTGAVTAQAGDYTAAQVGADPAGSAATAQAAAVQRANHTGTQLAATIYDFTSAVLAASPHPLGRYEDESWLVEDFDTFYSVRPFTYAANADVARAAATGVAAGMPDAHGVLRVYRTGFAPRVTLAAGYETSEANRTLLLSANPIILHASFSVEGWGTNADEIGYVLALSEAPLSGAGDPRQDNSCMLIFDWDTVTRVTAHTKAAGVLTETYATHALAVNTRINVTVVATSTSVSYYVNGALLATHTTNIPTGALCAWFGMCSFGATGQTAGFNIDLLALGRKYVAPRALQLPAGYGG